MESKAREKLILRMTTGLFGLSRFTAEVVVDYWLQREKALLDEIEEPLIMENANKNNNLTPKKYLKIAIQNALSIIFKHRDGL